MTGRNSQDTGVALESDDYVIIRGLTLRNFTGAAIRMGYCNGCAAEDNVSTHPRVASVSSRHPMPSFAGIRSPRQPYYQLQTDAVYTHKRITGTI